MTPGFKSFTCFFFFLPVGVVNDRMLSKRDAIPNEQEGARNLLQQMQEQINKLEAVSEDFKNVTKQWPFSTQSGEARKM